MCAHAGDSHRENPPVTTYHLQYRETHVNMLILNHLCAVLMICLILYDQHYTNIIIWLLFNA